MEEKKKKKKEVPVIVMFRNPDGSIGSIEVETVNQAKEVQTQLNDWTHGGRAMTKFIYLDD